MSRSVKRYTSSAAGTPIRELHSRHLTNQEFGRRLQDLLNMKGWKQSQLARAAFGTEINNDGHTVAKGRDRISAYVNGKQIPDTYNMQKLADALGVDIKDLAPDITSEAMMRETPDIYLHKVPNQDVVLLKLEKLLTLETAHKIMGLVIEDEQRALHNMNAAKRARDAASAPETSRVLEKSS